MREIQVLRYEATDGKIFECKEECVKHEVQLAAKELVDDMDEEYGYYGKIELEDLVEAFSSEKFTDKVREFAEHVLKLKECLNDRPRE